MAEESTGNRSRVLTWILAVALMLWVVIMVTCSQLQMAPTFDEQNHVTRGIAILRTGDFGYCFHHPPLANILEALPVAWSNHGFSTDSDAWRDRKNPQEIWAASYATIWEKDAANGVRLIQLARIPVLLFTLVLALVIFLWSRELFGPWGGLLSLTIFALDPTVLAHSGLATTDMAAACTILLAMFLLRKYLFAPSRARLLVAGVGVGLALVAKFSALILLPILAVLLLCFVWRAPRIEGSLPMRWIRLSLGTRFMRAVGAGLLILLIAGVTLWATYGFKIESIGSKPGQSVQASASFKQHIPIPALQYLRGMKAVKSEAKGKPAYLLGQVDQSGKGWWYYFPVTLVTKVPISELFLILGMLVLLVIPRTRTQLAIPRRELLFLLLPAAIYALAAMGALGTSWNMGIRHILPIFPFLFILIGGWVRILPSRRVYLPVFGVLLVAQCASVLCAFPDYIAYFNEAAGPRDQGYRLFVDSNIDWGQDLGRLAILQREQGFYPLKFSYFGSTPPEAYGIQYTPVAGFGIMGNASKPDIANYHGYFAISVTDLMAGEGYCHYDYRWLLHLTPVARAGKSILVYRFP